MSQLMSILLIYLRRESFKNFVNSPEHDTLTPFETEMSLVYVTG